MALAGAVICYAAVETTVGRSRWVLCGFLFLATTLNYLDRQVLGILAPTMQRELGLDNAALGTLFSVFYYTYTLAQFAVGPVLDRVNLRMAYGLAVLLWSLVGALTSTARGFADLVAFRLGLGVAESANWPAAMRMVARVLPPGERALGNGIFTSGTSIGALIAPALTLWIAGAFGWRMAFLGVGALGMVWFAGWMSFSRRREFGDVWVARRGSVAGGLAYGELLRSARFWRVFAVTVLVNPCLYFLLNWLPAYFSQVWKLDGVTGLGFTLTVIYVGLDAGYLVCGAGVLALTRRGLEVAAARTCVFVAASFLLSAAAFVPFAQTARAATVMLVVANVGIGIWIAMYLTMAQEVSVRAVSTAAGLLGGSGSLAGGAAMWAVGQVTQRTGSFQWVFFAVGAVAVLAAVAGRAVAQENRVEPDGAEEETR
ncbi:MAG: MFS transporter [Bryobacterales bacterium]|nr:MFS transporter [Bryobacterales bacterium]